MSCGKNRTYAQISPEGMGLVGRSARLGLAGPPALQQGGQLLPEEGEEVVRIGETQQAGVSGPRISAPSRAALAQWASSWSRPREISYHRSLRSRYTSRRLPGSRWRPIMPTCSR